MAWWWQKLQWSERAELRPAGEALSSTQVSYAELLIDFELTTGLRCSKDGQARDSWSERAKLLRVVLKILLNLRGGKGGGLHKFYGENRGRPSTSLAVFGAKRLPGLNRPPVFALGLSAVRCIATNAWAASL